MRAKDSYSDKIVSASSPGLLSSSTKSHAVDDWNHDTIATRADSARDSDHFSDKILHTATTTGSVGAFLPARENGGSMMRDSASSASARAPTNMSIFLNYASKECRKNIEALWRIREHCSKRSSLRREDEFDDHDDADLIPTVGRLRKSLPNPAEIELLLRCDCDLCGPQQLPPDDDERVRTLADDISRSDEKLKAFATLILAGCLFAWREYSRRPNDHLSEFYQRVTAENATGSDLRRRLFASVTSHECDHSVNARRKLRRQCSDCAGNAFRDAIRTKLRLLRIPVLQSTNMIEEYDDSDNLPFIQEDSDQVESSKATVRFWRCRIEPSHCTIEEAKTFELFRKRYRFTPGDVGIRRATQEAKVAMALATLDHDNIAKVLLAFKEDSEHTYVNLIFRRENHNLEDYFRQPALTGLLGGFQGRVGDHAVLLEHGLWKALMGIVDAVATLHEVAEGTITLKRPGPRIYGHFDLKPANILIGDGGNLLLTDFGQAATQTPGTHDYAPPECEQSDHGVLGQAYDTWSLACILLQALVFISGLSESDHGAGCRILESFYSRRYNQTTRNRAGGFWARIEGHGASQVTLRRAVTEELDRLEARRHHQTKVVVQQLRLMFEIDPKLRPKVRACFKKFKAGLGRDIFRSPGDRLVEPRLAEWHTSFTTEVQREAIPCRLFLYRKRDNGFRPAEINLTLEYEGEPSSHTRTDARMLHEVSFVPISFYDTRRISVSNELAHTTSREPVVLQCAFINIFRGVQLHFHRATDYYEFVTMCTNQIILPDVHSASSTVRARSNTVNAVNTVNSLPTTSPAPSSIRFRSCKLLEERKLPHRDKAYTLSDGCVQVWRHLLDDDYENRYTHGEEIEEMAGLQRASPIGRNNSNARVVTAPTSRMSFYKLALFGQDKETNSKVCVLVDIGQASYTLKGQPPTIFDFTQRKDHRFEAAIYRSTDELPGFPMSPVVIDRDVGVERGIKVRSMKLEMEFESDYKELRRILRSEGFPVN